MSIPIRCFSCLEVKPLTKEHIIPQAIGGRLKAKLYCKECNDTFGRTIDMEISAKFGHVGTLLQIKRERGKPEPFEVTAIESDTRFNFDGRNLRRRRPIVKYGVKEDGKTLDYADVTAGSKEELDKIMASLGAKYRMSGSDRRFQERHPGPTDTTYSKVFDTRPIRRAITKMAYSLLCLKIPSGDVLHPSFDLARAYVRNNVGEDLASANFVHTRFMSDSIRPLHKTHINLDRRKGIVVGYVMIFGIYKFSVLLAEDYSSVLEWPCLDYTYDPVTLNVIEGNPNFRAPAISKNQILRPKQSKAIVRRELIRGHKILEKYVDGYRFLDIDFE